MRGPAGWWFAPAGRPPFGLVVNLGDGLPHRGRAAGRPAGMYAHRPLTVSPSVSLAVLPSHYLTVSPNRRRAVPPGRSAPPSVPLSGWPWRLSPELLATHDAVPLGGTAPSYTASIVAPSGHPAGGGAAVPPGHPPERRRESPQPRRMSAHAILPSVRLTVRLSAGLAGRPAVCRSAQVNERPTFPATGWRSARPTFSPPDVPSSHLAGPAVGARRTADLAVRLSCPSSRLGFGQAASQAPSVGDVGPYVRRAPGELSVLRGVHRSARLSGCLTLSLSCERALLPSHRLSFL